MTERELAACKARLRRFIDSSSDAEFDALVAEASKAGFRELQRKLMIVWIEGAKTSKKVKQ